VWISDKAILHAKECEWSLCYLSRGKQIDSLPKLNPVVNWIQAPPDGHEAMKIPCEFKIDLNSALYIPYTRHLYNSQRPSFTLDFDLRNKSEDLVPGYPHLDPAYSRIAETLIPFAIANHVFVCDSCCVAAKATPSETAYESVQEEKRYRVYLVPKIKMADDVKTDYSFASGLVDEYMKDYLKLNTEWSFAPHLREQMKKSVTGVQFKAFVLPERGLDEWAEILYRRVFKTKRLHLILDLDKTLIRAFPEKDLSGITKLREQLGGKMIQKKQRDKDLPDELSGTDSFKITFQFNGKERTLWIKPRPYLKEFLFAASKRYEISVLSMGVPQYIAKVMLGLDKIYPGISKLVPPERVMSSAYTIAKFRKGNKDLRMMYPFCRFSDRRNTVVIVDDSIDVWEGKENFRGLVFPISRYEGYEPSEIVQSKKSSLEKCLDHLNLVQEFFYKDALGDSDPDGNRVLSDEQLQGCRSVAVEKVWPKVYKLVAERSKQKSVSARTIKLADEGNE